MADKIDDVVRVVSSENGITTLNVDRRYLAGYHPDQEAIEAECHQQMMDKLHEAGRRAAERLESEILKVMIGGRGDAYRVCPSVLTAVGDRY